MTPKRVLRQMMELNQAAFDHTFKALTLFQEQSERMINLSLEQAAMLPKEGEKVFTEWLQGCRKGSETFQKSVEDGFQRLEAFFA